MYVLAAHALFQSHSMHAACMPEVLHYAQYLSYDRRVITTQFDTARQKYQTHKFTGAENT